MVTEVEDDGSGKLLAHVEGFRCELARRGYSQSAAKKHGQLAREVIGWLDAEGLDAGALVDAVATDPFFARRRSQGRSNLLSARSLAPLIAYLRGIGLLVVSDRPAASGPVELFLDSYRTYLLREKGVVEGTARFYVHVARLFLAESVGPRGLDLSGLNGAGVISFAARACEHRGLSSARQVVSALRCVLRYLRAEGITTLALDEAVLSVAGWAPSLPRAMAAGDAARMLAGCDRATLIGRRDHAMLILMVRLGLRAGEVVALTPGDIDWRRGEFVVRGKRRREERLPLPADVGAAIVAYLRSGRPHSDSAEVFLSCCAPFGGLETGAVRGAVARACRRANVTYASPHRLRHTAATEMLRAGARLSDIAQVLRHRSPSTTAIYAHVDQARLASLARRWPGGAA